MKNTNVKVLADNLISTQGKVGIAQCNDHIVEMHTELNNYLSAVGSCRHSDLGFYVLEGTLNVRTANQDLQIEGGAFCQIPKGLVFQTKSLGKTSYLLYIREHCSFTEEDFKPTELRASVVNVVDKASSKDTDHCNFSIAIINDHEVRLGIHKGDYAEHHHSNSDECFLFLEGKYFLAHMFGEEELQCFDFVHVDKLEAHKPYMPKRTYLLYFHKKGIKTISYAGSELNFFTDV